MDRLKNAKLRPYLLDVLCCVAIVITTMVVYSYLFRSSEPVIYGDEPRYHTYQTLEVKRSLLSDGQLGFWDPYISSGASWLSHPGGKHFSPFTWLVIPFFSDPYAATKVILLSHVILAGMAFYALLRTLGLHQVASLFATIPFIANRYAITFAINGWLEELFGLLLIPLSVLALWRSVNQKSIGWAIVCGLVMSLHFFDTTYYVFHYNVIALLWVFGVYVLAKAIPLVRGRTSFLKPVLPLIGVFVVVWLVMAGLSAIKLLPLLEFRSISSRLVTPLSDIETPDAIMTFSFYFDRIRHMITEPFISGAANTNRFTEIANLLAAFAVGVSFVVAIIKRNLLAVTFVGLLILGSWGYFANRAPIDVYKLFYEYLPGFNSNVFPYRFIILIHFAFFVCVAIGLNSLIKQRALWLVRGAAYIAGVMLVLTATIYTTKTLTTLQARQPIGVDYASEINQASVSVQKPSSFAEPPQLSGDSAHILTKLAALVAVYNPEGRVYSTITSAPNAITTTEILQTNIPIVHHSYEAIIPTYQFGLVRPINPVDSPEQVAKKYKILSVLNTRFQLQGHQTFDFTGCPSLTPAGFEPKPDKNLAPPVCEMLSSRLHSLDSNDVGTIFYDSAALPKVSVFPAAILVIGDNRFNDFESYIAKQLLFHDDFNEQKVTIFSAKSKAVEAYSLRQLQQFPTIILVDPNDSSDKAKQRLAEYEQAGGLVIRLTSHWRQFDNLHKRSMSIFTNEPAWIYSDDDKQTIGTLFQEMATQSATSSVTINKMSGEVIDLTVQTDRDGQAVQFSDSYFPGWRVKVDGKPADLYMADGLVKGVVIPTAGTHTVRFYYLPSTLLIGGAISLVTIIGIAGYVVSRRRRWSLFTFR